MVPLVFILVVSLVLLLLVYWVLSTLKWDEIKESDAGSFFFETAPEFYTWGYLPDIDPYLPYKPNEIRLCRGNSSHLLTYWLVEEDKKAEFMAANNIKGELILRIYQTSGGIVFEEISVSSLKDSYSFEVKPEKAYYTVLGFKNENSFHPWLYSNTLLTYVHTKGSRGNSMATH